MHVKSATYAAVGTDGRYLLQLSDDSLSFIPGIDQGARRADLNTATTLDTVTVIHRSAEACTRGTFTLLGCNFSWQSLIVIGGKADGIMAILILTNFNTGTTADAAVSIEGNERAAGIDTELSRRVRRFMSGEGG